MSNINQSLLVMIFKQSYPRALLRIKNRNIRWLIKGMLSPYFGLKALYTVNSNKIILTGIELQITEKCNLNCKDCSILIPYIQNPRHKSANEIFESLDELLALIDYIPNVRVIGGEILLHPELPQILEKLCSERKIGSVSLMTNGTLSFSEKYIPILRNKKIFVMISDYGTLSYKKDKLINQLHESDINYSIIPFTSWNSFGGFEKRNYSAEQLKDMYKKCEIKYSCTQLFDHKLTTCARAENLYNMGIDHDEETFGFLDISKIKSKDEMRRKLKEFYALEYISACNYCSAATKDMIEIPAAIQLEKGTVEHENTSN